MTSPLPEGWAELHPALAQLPEKLQELLSGVHAAAHELVARRGHPVRPDEVSFFCPVSAVADSLGVKHNTVSTWFRRYPVLRQLVSYQRISQEVWDAKTQRTQRWHAGAVWWVRFAPGTVRVRHEDLAFCWRDLQRDIRDGHTVEALRRSGEEPLESVHDTVLAWTNVPPQPPLELDRRNDDSPFADDPMQAVKAAHDANGVDQAATHIARVFHDHTNLNCWRRVLWTAQARRRLPHLADLVARTLADAREWPTLRSPAALLVSRARGCGYL
jgi:hypothetical protein